MTEMRVVSLQLLLVSCLLLKPAAGQNDTINIIWDHDFFPSLTEESKEYGLWPLLTPLSGNVKAECRSQGIRYIQALSKGDITSGAMYMLDATGRLPMEGMLNDIMELTTCELLGLFEIPCESIPESIANMIIRIPFGYTFDPGSVQECLAVQEPVRGKHCLSLVLPDIASILASAPGNLAVRMDNFELLRKYIQRDFFLRNIFESSAMQLERLRDLRDVINVNISQILPVIEQAEIAVFSLWALVHLVARQKVGYGMCIPDPCTYEDISENMKNFTGLPLFNSMDLFGSAAPNSHFFCVGQDDPVPWDSTATFILVTLSILGGLLVLGTLVDMTRLALQVYHTDHSPVEPPRPSYGLQLLLAFSLYSNLTAIMSTKKSSGGDNLHVLNGIRFISMSWVVLGHCFLFFSQYLTVSNVAETLRIQGGGLGIPFRAVVNALPSVDTFFMLSGLLVAYLTLRELDKCRGKFSFITYYVHRYIRLTIPLAFLIAFVIAFVPVLAHYLQSQFSIGMSKFAQESCSTHGWTLLLYVNNFFDGANNCIGVTWYLCDDMIYFWLSPLIIYPMWSNAVPGALAWWSVWTLAFTFGPMYVTGRHGVGFNGDIVAGVTDEDWYFRGRGMIPYFYWAPWIRFQPYLVGILVGYMLHRYRGKEVKLDSRVNLMVWQVAFLAAFAVVYGIDNDYSNNSLWELVLYNGLQRLAWSLAVGWVIFSCTKGYGGPVGDFLSWSFFTPLSRISFMTYLLHSFILIITATYFSTFAVEISWFLLTLLYCGGLLISMFVALLFTLAFESPFIRLEKLILGGLLATSKQNGQKTK